MTRPRAIFFGTPEFAVPALASLSEIADVVLVVTQPDRPKGRGMKLAPPPVKLLAEQLRIPVLQPTKVRTPEFASSLHEQHADVALVVAYGRILPLAVLNAPRLGCLNVHASLLPKLRGAAPIQWAIARGDRESGVCLMHMDEGLDTGPVLARASLAIEADETAGELSPRLAALGALLVQQQLPRFLAGELLAVPQDHPHATLAPLLSKENGLVDWTQSARAIHDLARGFAPWPSAYTDLDGSRLKLHRTRVLVEQSVGAPGEIVRVERDAIVVRCGQGSLALLEVQLEGAKRLTAADFAAGQHLVPNKRLGA
jgi:methionyl-tRNA formyltransferase